MKRYIQRINFLKEIKQCETDLFCWKFLAIVNFVLEGHPFCRINGFLLICQFCSWIEIHRNNCETFNRQMFSGTDLVATCRFRLTLCIILMFICKFAIVTKSEFNKLKKVNTVFEAQISNEKTYQRAVSKTRFTKLYFPGLRSINAVNLISYFSYKIFKAIYNTDKWPAV